MTTHPDEIFQLIANLNWVVCREEDTKWNCLDQTNNQIMG